MKSLILLAFFALASGLENLDPDTKDQLKQIDASIETILKSIVYQQGDNIEYFWDRFNPVVRFALLNQTQMSSFDFNISQGVIDSPGNLNWTYLPNNVKEFLLNQQQTVLYLTLGQLGWIEYDSDLAASTFYSLISSKGALLLPSIWDSAAPLRYDSKIDMTKLKFILTNTLQPFHHQIRPYHHLMQAFDEIDEAEYLSYFKIVNQFFFNFFRYFKKFFEQSFDENIYGLKKDTAANIFSKAVLRIQVFLKNNNISF